MTPIHYICSTLAPNPRSLAPRPHYNGGVTHHSPFRLGLIQIACRFAEAMDAQVLLGLVPYEIKCLRRSRRAARA